MHQRDTTAISLITMFYELDKDKDKDIKEIAYQLSLDSYYAIPNIPIAFEVERIEDPFLKDAIRLYSDILHSVKQDYLDLETAISFHIEKLYSNLEEGYIYRKSSLRQVLIDILKKDSCLNLNEDYQEKKGNKVHRLWQRFIKFMNNE